MNDPRMVDVQDPAVPSPFPVYITKTMHQQITEDCERPEQFWDQLRPSGLTFPEDGEIGKYVLTVTVSKVMMICQSSKTEGDAIQSLKSMAFLFQHLFVVEGKCTDTPGPKGASTH